jgi:hypothetical protein
MQKHSWMLSWVWAAFSSREACPAWNSEHNPQFKLFRWYIIFYVSPRLQHSLCQPPATLALGNDACLMLSLEPRFIYKS